MKYTIRRELTRKEEYRSEDGTRYGMRNVHDGYEEADITVEINVEAIAKRLGSTAMKNKSGFSKFMHGAVVVRASNIRRV